MAESNRLASRRAGPVERSNNRLVGCNRGDIHRRFRYAVVAPGRLERHLAGNADVIVAAEDVSVGKPDPSGYLLAMELVAKKTRPLKPADCLVIEDAPTVVQTSREAGFVVLGVATSYPPEKLAHANHVVKTLQPAEVLGKIPRLKVGI